jgi:hypothetical protein
MFLSIKLKLLWSFDTWLIFLIIKFSSFTFLDFIHFNTDKKEVITFSLVDPAIHFLEITGTVLFILSTNSFGHQPNDLELAVFYDFKFYCQTDLIISFHIYRLSYPKNEILYYRALANRLTNFFRDKLKDF